MSDTREDKKVTAEHTILIRNQFPIEVDDTAAFHFLPRGSNHLSGLGVIAYRVHQAELFHESPRNPIARLTLSVQCGGGHLVFTVGRSNHNVGSVGLLGVSLRI